MKNKKFHVVDEINEYMHLHYELYSIDNTDHIRQQLSILATFKEVDRSYSSDSVLTLTRGTLDPKNVKYRIEIYPCGDSEYRISRYCSQLEERDPYKYDDVSKQHYIEIVHDLKINEICSYEDLKLNKIPLFILFGYKIDIRRSNLVQDSNYQEALKDRLESNIESLKDCCSLIERCAHRSLESGISDGQIKSLAFMLPPFHSKMDYEYIGYSLDKMIIFLDCLIETGIKQDCDEGPISALISYRQQLASEFDSESEQNAMQLSLANTHLTFYDSVTFIKADLGFPPDED